MTVSIAVVSASPAIRDRSSSSLIIGGLHRGGETVEPSAQTALDGAGRNLQRLGGLELGPVEEISTHDDGPLLDRKRCKRPIEGRIDLGRRWRLRSGDSERKTSRIHLRRRASPVEPDAVDPAGRIGVPTDIVPPLKGAGHRLGGRIGGEQIVARVRARAEAIGRWWSAKNEAKSIVTGVCPPSLTSSSWGSPGWY